MARTPKSRHSDPGKSGSTIDIDPKDVKRVGAETPAPEDGVSDTTSTKGMKAEGEDQPRRKPETKTAPEKPVPAKPESSKTDEKPAAATPSAFATKPAESASRPPSETRKRERGGSALLGGIVGGLIVLALGAGLQAVGIWPDSGGVNDERDIAMQTEMESLRSDINQLRAVSGDSAATDERLAALESAIAEAGNAPDAEAALADVEQRLASAGEASAGNASRLDAIEQGLTELETRLASLEETNPGQRIIATSALKSAIDRGQAFSAELDAYAALGGAADGLRPYAEDGIPTRADIDAEAEDAARAMIAAGSGTDDDAGFLDRLGASARSLVQVRPVGMAEGEDVAAIVARLETAVRQDDYARAISEYESLPADVQEAGAGFMEKVRARHAADQLIDEALAAALQDS